MLETMRWTLPPLALAVLLGGCGREPDPGQEEMRPAPTVESPADTQPDATQPMDRNGFDLRLEVDVSARELHVYRNGERTATHPVAVGSEEWPTPTGEWTIGQVIWNPRWVPPDEEWAQDEEEKEPGDPENPLGRAQLVYDIPNSIHGTPDPSSLGQAVSHGSIRVSNEVAMELARMVMEAGGAGRDEQWYQNARSDTSQRRDVSIPDPVPIRVF